MQLIWASDQSVLVRGLDSALGLFHALRNSGDRRPPGVTDLSPARHSILIRFDLRLTDHDTVEHWVREASTAGIPEFHGKLVDIPARYDGPDLDAVAQASGLDAAQVIALHSGTEYTVHFLGFAPGFAYLGDVPDAIAIGRQATPRLSVPAGSIGIAGRQTGVYPATLPGGWNLIGTTETQMFDVQTSKCLLEPGDRVRFVPV